METLLPAGLIGFLCKIPRVPFVILIKGILQKEKK